LHPDVENLGLDYENFVDRALKLNQSYLDLLKLFEEVSLVPALLKELEKDGSSPLKVVDAILLSQLELRNNFTELAKLITNTQSRFINDPEAMELKAISHNCQVMEKFISDIDFNQLKQMFVELSNP
jgi:anion-transporting  ArsA/GET3 family ATPase